MDESFELISWKSNCQKYLKFYQMWHHCLNSFGTTDFVIIKDFLSSAPKTSKRTRRPRPKAKTTTTAEAPLTKPGKLSFWSQGDL